MIITGENSIEKFTNSELRYFSPMKFRQNKYSSEDLYKFSLETVKQRSERISNEVYDIYKDCVKYGQFKGLKLLKSSTWSVNNLGLMCMGHEVMNFIFSKYLCDKKIFINIGSGIGYYVVGVLKSGFFNTSIGFELDDSSRNLIYENWKVNGKPGNLEIHGDVFLDFKIKLENLNLSESFIMIDIVGSEFYLLTEENLFFLSKYIILVEIHNWADNFEYKYISLLKYAYNFFDVKVLERQEKETINIEELRSITDDNRMLLISESRPCLMRYLVFFPKNEN